MFRIQNVRFVTISVLILFLASGCSDDVSRIAREAADRQAQQNTEMANLNREVAGGTHRLVEADAQARKEIIGVHHELQSERSRLDTSWNALEQERQRIASERTTKSAWIALAPYLGGALLLAVLLGYCWYALVSTHNSDDTACILNEILIDKFVHDEQVLLTNDNCSQALLGQVRLDD